MAEEQTNYYSTIAAFVRKLLTDKSGFYWSYNKHFENLYNKPKHLEGGIQWIY